MERKGGIEDVDGLGREEAAVEGAGDSSSKVRAVGVGGEALLHADAAVGGEELEEDVEVVGGEIGEEGRELGRVEAGRLVALHHVLYDEVHHVYGVAPARAPEVRHHEGHLLLRLAQPHPVEGLPQQVHHRPGMLRLIN